MGSKANLGTMKGEQLSLIQNGTDRKNFYNAPKLKDVAKITIKNYYELTNEKICFKCKKSKGLKLFHKSVQHPLGVYPYCIECITARDRGMAKERNDKLPKIINLIGEEWRHIEGWGGLYQVSNMGRVKSLARNFKRERILIPCKRKKGYLCVGLARDCKKIQKSIHRLVAIAFIPNPENKPEVNHKRGFKWDNRATELEWSTMSENQIHAYRVLKRKNNLKGLFGKLNSNSRAVFQYSLSGQFIEKFYSTMDAQRKTGISNQSISSCALCKRKHKTAGGYIWMYS